MTSPPTLSASYDAPGRTEPGFVVASQSPARSTAEPQRLSYIDNVRWVAILLVVSMHAAVTYSPFGNWYYREHPPLDLGSTLFFATYQSFLQAFFMALLFFVAGYFVPRSYDSKGPLLFLKDRFLRLGLPTVLFVVVIGPVTEYFIAHSWHTQESFGHEMALYFLKGRFLAGTGPLWFCVALLIFSCAYALFRLASGAGKIRTYEVRAAGVALAIAAIAGSTFLVRIATPAGTSFYNMQLGDFPSYALMFALGIAANRSAWLKRLSAPFARRTAMLCLLLAALIWWPLLAYGGALSGETSTYQGGWHWQSAAMATWETLVCVGMTFAALAGFRAFAASQGPIAKFMSDNAFAVYVIHPPVLIIVAIALSGVPLTPIPKFVLLWVLGAALSFGVAAPLARRLPVLRQALR